MEWIHHYQLFLFDLDGLLVNTESLHYLAYKNMLQAHNHILPWDFNRYCMTAHYHSDKIAEEFLELFPDLYSQGHTWDDLYNEKKQMIMDLMKSGEVSLMPGVYELLEALHQAKIKSCLVTHSPDDLVSIARSRHPILDTIPYRITRHDYTHPKPHPEAYLKAIDAYAAPGDRIIGFEDTPRGLRALMGTIARPVLICEVNYPEIPEFVRQGVSHFPTFAAITDENILS